MRRFLLVPGCLAILWPFAAHRQQQAPIFQSRLDVVAVDVHAVDRAGRPVADLRPDEFTVTVEGKPRSIVAADYISYPTATATSAAPVPAPPRPVFSTNRSGPAARPGRWILLVVDEDNIGAGYARGAADAAARFLDQVQPNDRVGLLAIPRSATHIDPTTDRTAVRQALQRISGHMVSMETMLSAVRHVAMSEAFMLRNDPPHWWDVIDRECIKPGSLIPVGLMRREQELGSQGIKAAIQGRTPLNVESAIADYLACKAEVDHYAMTMVQDVRDRTLNSTRALLALLESIAAVPGPKTIVFISQELPVSSYMSERADFNVEISRLTPAAARAQATFYILHLDRPPFDVETRMSPTASAADTDMRTFGLETVTSVTGGKRLMVSGRVEGAMDRVALEISGYYLLGFRTEAADRDGKPHNIKVTVTRPGVELRARPMFAFSDDAAAKNADGDAAATVSRLLRAPAAATALPVSLTTYVLPDPGNPAQMRLLVAAEIDRLDAQDTPTTVGYVILGGNGRNAGGTIEQLVLKSAPADPDRRLQYLAAATVPPGNYTLRFAAVDAALRAGSVDHPFEARLTSVGPLALGDLVVFDRFADDSGKPRPSVPATVSGSLNGYLEAYATTSPLPTGIDVRLELADVRDAPARAKGAMAAQATATAGRLPLNGSLSLAGVPPGDYVARAVVSSGNTVLGQVVRPVHVVAGPANPAAPVADPTAIAAAKPAAPPMPAAQPPVSPPPPAAAVTSAPAATARATEMTGARRYTAPAGTVEELLQRVGEYCVAYGDQMSLIIGVERYSQWMQNEDAPRPTAKTLVSEFALVRARGDWDGFRDVYEVDGKPVIDRHDRLMKLFTESPGSAVEQSRKIASESARYNVGAIQRNFNVPTTALFFVTTGNQARFKFRKDGEDRIGGAPVWVVRYEETRKPTIIRTSQGKDMPVHGTFWIDPVQGRVLKTHMEITSEAMLTADRGDMSNDPGGFGALNKPQGAQNRWDANRRVNTSASITVTYRQEPNMGLLVPAEMLETYEGPTRSAFTGNESVSKINCRATYSDFKRFETGARVIPR